ncbi:hypothetical protein EBR78_00195 [bacterium]|nr:hypothetical protein [bacterium]NBX82130.1 hypothetical protein [bacterium]
MRLSWHLSGVLLGLSLGVLFWTAQELEWAPSSAATAADQVEGNSDRQKFILQERERAVSEQVARHEKILKERQDKEAIQKKQAEEQAQVLVQKYKKQIEEKDSEIKKLKADLDELKSKNMESIIGIYEKMDPKQAAKILGELEVKQAARITLQMKPQRAAEVLGKMSPEKARSITEFNIQGRVVASKPTEEKISQKVNDVPENDPIAPIGSKQ